MWHLSDWFGVLLKEFSFFVSMSWSFFMLFVVFVFVVECDLLNPYLDIVFFLWLWLEKFYNWQNHWSSLKFVCPVWCLPVHFSITFLHFFSLFFVYLFIQTAIKWKQCNQNLSQVRPVTRLRISGACVLMAASELWLLVLICRTMDA